MKKFIVIDSSDHEWVILADKADVNSIGILVFVKDNLLITVFNADSWSVCRSVDDKSDDDTSTLTRSFDVY